MLELRSPAFLAVARLLALCAALHCATAASAQTASPQNLEPATTFRPPQSTNIIVIAQAYEKHLSEHPSDIPARVDYARFLMSQGQLIAAKEQSLRAIKIKPDSAPAHCVLSFIEQDLCDFKEAIRSAEDSLRLDPNIPWQRYRLATFYFLYRKECESLHGWKSNESVIHALSEFKLARGLAPQNYQYAAAYAETFYMLQPPDWAEAEQAWLVALPLASEPQMVLSHLGRICIEAGKYDAAERYLKSVTLPFADRLREKLAEKRQQATTGAHPTSAANSTPHQP